MVDRTGVAAFFARNESRFPHVQIDDFHESNFTDEDLGEVNNFKDLKNDPTQLTGLGFSQVGDYRRVGTGPVTNPDKCGMFSGYDICDNVAAHNLVTLDGEKYHGKVFWRKKFHSCDKPSCPVCAKRGWAVREARKVAERLHKISVGYVDSQGKKRAGLGQVEHIILSPPESCYGLKFESLKAKTIKVLASRGILGGAMIFHAFRYLNYYEAQRANQPMGWYLSLHFHILGFVNGGYGRCRGCKRDREECMSCSGFEGLTRRRYYEEEKHGGGWICKIVGERRSVFGTAWYQLTDCLRFHVNWCLSIVIWF